MRWGGGGWGGYWLPVYQLPGDNYRITAKNYRDIYQSSQRETTVISAQNSR